MVTCPKPETYEGMIRWHEDHAAYFRAIPHDWARKEQQMHERNAQLCRDLADGMRQLQKESMVPVPKSILMEILKRHDAGLPMTPTHASDLRGFIRLSELMKKSKDTG